MKFTLRTKRHPPIEIDSEDRHSLSIQNIVRAHNDHLTSEARALLEKTELFGADQLVCDAYPMKKDGKNCIVVPIGFFQLLRFYVDLQNILVLLMPEKDTVTVDAEEVEVGLAASMAGHVIMSHAMDTAHQLFDLSNILGPNAKVRSDYGYGAAALFVVLHELGHLKLGHLDSGYVSEISTLELVVEEAISPFHRMELEADAFALNCMVPEIRTLVMSSVIYAFAPFGFRETFNGSGSAAHPLVANRLNALAKRLGTDSEPQTLEIIKSIIHSEASRYLRMKAARDAEGGAVAMKLSLHEAHKVMNRVGNWVVKNKGKIDFDIAV